MLEPTWKLCASHVWGRGIIIRGFRWKIESRWNNVEKNYKFHCTGIFIWNKWSLKWPIKQTRGPFFTARISTRIFVHSSPLRWSRYKVNNLHATRCWNLVSPQHSLSQWTLKKKSLNFIFPTKYVIPKSLNFSHWLSKNIFHDSTTSPPQKNTHTHTNNLAHRHMDVSKNKGEHPKMDGENDGTPYEQMGWFGGFPIIWGFSHGHPTFNRESL